MRIELLATVPRAFQVQLIAQRGCSSCRRPPAQRPDGEAILRDVERHLLTRLRAAKKLAAPAYVRWYAIGYHSLLIARVMRQKEFRP